MSTSSAPGKQALEPRRVLIVDDDVDLAESLQDILETRGYAVKTAGSIREAEAAAKDFDVQVALLDIRLGQHNGLDLIAILKRDRPDLVCIAVSAYSDFDYAIEAFRLGAVDYLPKPVHPAHVEALPNRNASIA